MTTKSAPFHLLLTPKSHAEWTFRPRRALRRTHADVGVFMNHGEVLNLMPIRKVTLHDKILRIPIFIGVVDIIDSEWEIWTSSIESVASIFDENRVLAEYNSDT